MVSLKARASAFALPIATCVGKSKRPFKTGPPSVTPIAAWSQQGGKPCPCPAAWTFMIFLTDAPPGKALRDLVTAFRNIGED
jgi:hypothetical protein